MTDITTVWRTDSGDWVMDGPQLASGNDLATAILLSVFTDRRATPDDVARYGLDDPKGWWADDPLRPMGSRLWLLRRAKQEPETLRRAKDYITEALQWLLVDQVVARLDVACEWVKPGVLGATVTAVRANGTQQAMQYAWVWN